MWLYSHGWNRPSILATAVAAIDKNNARKFTIITEDVIQFFIGRFEYYRFECTTRFKTNMLLLVTSL